MIDRSQGLQESQGRLHREEIPELDLKGIVGDRQVDTMQKESPGDGVCRGVEMCIRETTSADHFKRF